MKTLLSVLVAAGVGFVAAYLIVAQQVDGLKSERSKLEAQFQSEKDRLESALAAAKNKNPSIERIKTEVAVAAKRSPKEILENLLTLKPAGTTRIATIRKIVHELEDLAQLKYEALPAIREFLTRNADLDYSVERSDRGDNSQDSGRWTPPWSRSAPPTEFTLPPSLRIGLFDVLKEIGGEEAEKIMAEVMGGSGRAVEVAYLARALQDIAPGKYREVAINSAKDLLRNPLPIDNPNRLDDQAESYLYSVLEMYNDNSFADEAKKLLVSSDGHVDRNARDYLTKTQGEKAIPTLYDAFKNGAISNTWEKASLGGKILDYVGPNQQANNFLNEIVSDTNIDSRMRSFSIMRLAGGFGGAESPTDPDVINSRIQVAEALKGSVNDERLTRTIDLTQRNLTNLLNGQPIENPFDRGNRGGRGPGGGENNGPRLPGQ